MNDILNDSVSSIQLYNKDFNYDLIALRQDDPFIMDYLIEYLNENPQHGALYISDDKVKGVLVVEPDGDYADISIFVGISYRNSGIGSAMLNMALSAVSHTNITEVICSFNQIDGYVRDFLIHRNFKPWSSSLFMEYDIEENIPLISSNLEIVSYKDEYFEEAFSMCATAFHNMRKSLGLTSQCEKSDDKKRIAWSKNADNIFLLIEKNAVAALLILEGNEIDTVAVDIKKQRRGFGRIMIRYALHTLKKQGYDSCELWCAADNPAHSLYEAEGFRITRHQELLSLQLNKDDEHNTDPISPNLSD